MTSLEFGECVPVPVEKFREDLRLHFAFLQFFIALPVAVVACRAGAWRRRIAIRINRRHEHDVLSVGRPDRAVSAG